MRPWNFNRDGIKEEIKFGKDKNFNNWNSVFPAKKWLSQDSYFLTMKATV